MSESSSSSSSGASVGGIVGMLLAGWASYTLGNAPGWIAIHAIFNWFYLIYLCSGCGGGLPVELFGEATP